MANFEAQCANAIVDHFGFVGTEKQNVAVLGVGAFQNFGNGGIVQVFHDGALQTVAAFGHFVDLDPGQAFGTVDFDELGVAIDFTTTDFGATWNAQCHHAASWGSGGGAEHFEVDIAHDVGQFSEFEFHTQVGLVGAEAVHGL